MARDPVFVHLTDIHIGRPDDPHLHSDTLTTLRAALAEIARIAPAPDFIVASGDLTNAGDAESFRVLAAEMARTGLPVIWALGNHDTREGFHEAMTGSASSAPLDHDAVHAGVHVIALDTSVPGAIGGALDEAQFGFLEDRLAAHPGLPKLIVAHHPPNLAGGADDTPWRALPPEQSARLGDLIEGRGVVGILSGHIHHDRFSLWRGVPVIVGAGLHAATDILAADRLRMVRGAGFGIGTIRPSGLTLAVVPLPQDRAELANYPLVELRERALARDGAAFARAG